MANISTFLQENYFLPLLTSTPFVESRQKEMNGLLEKRVLKMVSILEMPKNMRILNSYFIDEIKKIVVANVIEKSRIVVQAYNKYNKMLILI